MIRKVCRIYVNFVSCLLEKLKQCTQKDGFSVNLGLYRLLYFLLELYAYTFAIYLFVWLYCGFI